MIPNTSISAYIAYLKKKFNLSPSKTSRLKGIGKCILSSRSTKQNNINPISSNTNFFKNTSLSNITSLTNVSNFHHIRNLNNFNPVNNSKNLTTNQDFQHNQNNEGSLNSNDCQDIPNFKNLQNLQNLEELKELVHVHEFENTKNLKNIKSLKNVTFSKTKNSQESKNCNNNNNNLNKVCSSFKNIQNFANHNIPPSINNLSKNINYKHLNESKIGYTCKCFLRGIESPQIKPTAKRNSARKKPIHMKNLTNYFGRPPKILTITTTDLLNPNFSVTYLNNKDENGVFNLNNSCSSSFMFKFPNSTCLQPIKKDKDLNEISKPSENTVNFEVVKPFENRRAKELLEGEIEKIKVKSKSVSKHYSKEQNKEKYKHIFEIRTPSKGKLVSKISPNNCINDIDNMEKDLLGSQFEIPIETPKLEFHKSLIQNNNMKTDLEQEDYLHSKMILSEIPEQDKNHEMIQVSKAHSKGLEAYKELDKTNDYIEKINHEQQECLVQKQAQNEEKSLEIIPTVLSDINKGENSNGDEDKIISISNDRNHILMNNEKEIESKNLNLKLNYDQIESYDTKARERRIRV